MGRAVTVHVELLPGLITFCGQAPAALGPGDPVVAARLWSVEPEQVQQATCEGCLLKLFMLGDSANIALRRMGRAVEVHDVDPVSIMEN